MHHGKIVFVGDGGVGKTSIIERYINSTTKTTPTVGARSLSVLIKDAKNNDLILNIWDTGGNDLKCFIPMYSRGLQIIILVFDQSNRRTFYNLKNWVKFIKEEINVCKIFFVGNKSDRKSFFNVDKYKTFSTNNGGSFFSTSAVSGEGIDNLFKEIVEYISSQRPSNGSVDEIDIRNDKTSNGSDSTNNGSRSCCCC